MGLLLFKIWEFVGLEGKLAIITGTSKGIGKATAELLLENGLIVAGWSRSKSVINHANYHHQSLDISNFEEVKKAYSEAKQNHGIPFCLVNNAGLGFANAIEDTDLDKWKLMFDVNVHGLFYCTKLVLPDMKSQESGHIINISSIAGTNGIEFMSGYCGTKHAVRGISHSVYKEARNFGVKVTCIYPGSVQTNFFDEIDSVTANENMMQPVDIASTIWHALSSSPNYHHVDIEVRPLQPKGKK